MSVPGRLSAVLFVLGAAACSKKIQTSLPAPSQPSPSEIAGSRSRLPEQRVIIQEFAIEPSIVEPGQTAVVRWSVQGANAVSLSPDAGPVEPEGQKHISPTASGVYTLRATGPGGEASAIARVEIVRLPKSVSSDAAHPNDPSFKELLARDVSDIYFNYAQAEFDGNNYKALVRNGEALLRILLPRPGNRVVVEGHADEQGSDEYNVGLSALRALSVAEYLITLGVPNERLVAIGFGKESPQCTDANEDCWRKNRRVHFAPASTR